MLHERINILDHRALGQKVIEWANDPEARPKTLPEFAEQLQGIVKTPLPDWLKGLQFVQSNMEVLLIRLPPQVLVQETIDAFQSGGGNDVYPLPPFYAARLLNGEHSDNREFFEFRVGDYTLAHCS